MDSQPPVPPRPARSGATAQKQETPQIPPRPHRRSDQQELPNREAFARSPLNDPLRAPGNGIYNSGRNLSVSDLPDRPPSVNLPSIGQEGNEYDSVEDLSRTLSATSPETRNVSADLPMHQPKASVPQSTATSRIQPVTRTDSSQAVAAGLEQPGHHGDQEPDTRSLRMRASFNRSNQNMISPRPNSMHEDSESEHGIPELGYRIPLYKNAGDVQAPSPAPPSAGGAGSMAPPPFPGSGQPGERNHHRRRSSRQEFGPPGSYGLHGHGVIPNDPFEKTWYQKHPDELKKEINRHYDPGHPESPWALSSEDLNKLVHGSGKRILGSGATPDIVSTPDEQIGYKASEDYATQLGSPKPSPLHTLKPRPSSVAQPHAESPLRTASFPINDAGGSAVSDVEGDKLDISSQQRQSKMHGGEYDAPTADLGPEGGNSAEEGGWIHERGYGVPILASDEVARNPEGEYMQPAVDPEHERYGESYGESGRRSGQARSRSRPGSSGEPLTRMVSRDVHDNQSSQTPLEEIQEYEPLFPDDDEGDQKPMTSADKLNRPDLARHHFPSQDIWEDNPGSLALTTTVSTPQLPEEENESRPSRGAQKDAASTFEHPDVEAQRKNGNIPSDRAHYMTQEGRDMTKSMFKPGVAEDMSGRPGSRRFPSQDIWEDSPDSLRLETTVSHPQTEEITSPQEKSKPQVPPRPGGAKQAPSIPERPKPSVASKPRDAQTEATSPPEVKAKPAVPSRPEGGKFASVKASFMNDLNSRLKLGPQGPPPKKEESQEEEAAAEEKAPLEDARKGRARGPARRKPATAAAAEVPSEATPSAAFSLCAPRTIFSLGEDGLLDVPSGNVVAATGTEMRPDILQSEPLPPSQQQDSAISDKSARLTGLSSEAIGVGFHGDTPDPHISDATVDRHAAIAPVLSEALQTADREVASMTSDTAHQAAVRDVPVAHQTPMKDAPATTAAESSTTAAPSSSKMVDESSQTGQHDITFTNPEGQKDQFTTYLGGKAPEHGNVIVKDGEEMIGEVNLNTPRKIETTGHGM